MGEEGEEWEINTASARMAERVQEGDGKKIDCLKLKAGKKTHCSAQPWLPSPSYCTDCRLGGFLVYSPVTSSNG